MKTSIRLSIAFLACAALVLTAAAGPAPIYKESKEVVPQPLPACDWSGFYVGLHVGAQFGHSENVDHDYNVGPIPATSAPSPLGPRSTSPDRPWGYSESGVVAGGQAGYNFQFGMFVFGPEFDLGYMNLDGRGTEPGSPGGDTRGESDSDLYITLRGRLGVSLDWHGCWLLYATGGVIGINYDTRVVDDCVTGDCGDGLIDAHKQEFNWGPTVGGGIERQIGRHWSIKLEYLYYQVEDQSFDGTATFITASTSRPATLSAGVLAPQGRAMNEHDFSGDTHGHIIRAGLNFRF
ncbi:MAG: outer membrane beta-barrel protein [Verrucomicrobiota bacterium]